jgi:hypothetical protein
MGGKIVNRNGFVIGYARDTAQYLVIFIKKHDLISIESALWKINLMWKSNYISKSRKRPRKSAYTQMILGRAVPLSHAA